MTLISWYSYPQLPTKIYEKPSSKQPKICTSAASQTLTDSQPIAEIWREFPLFTRTRDLEYQATQ